MGQMDSFYWSREKQVVNANTNQFIIILSLQGSHISPIPEEECALSETLWDW